MSCSPQPLRRVQRIDIEVLPPCEFVTALAKLAMMKPAEWDSEFVTHFAPECPLLSKPKVMPTSCDRGPNRAGWSRTLR
jgi:hypothetical protein